MRKRARGDDLEPGSVVPCFVERAFGRARSLRLLGVAPGPFVYDVDLARSNRDLTLDGHRLKRCDGLRWLCLMPPSSEALAGGRRLIFS